MRKLLIVLILLALAGLGGAWFACGKSARPAGGRATERRAVSYPVEVQSVSQQTLVYTIDAVGSISAFEEVQVTARVEGAVDRVLFSEGSTAGSGSVLVEIATERYRLAVAAARAAHEKTTARLADIEAGMVRREAAYEHGLIAREEVDNWRTNAAVAKSDVAQTRAALDQANLNLRDAYVRAPIAGIMQTRTVQTGQYVKTGDVLATLIRRDPLLLRFTIAENDARQVRPGVTALFTVQGDNRQHRAAITHVAAAADAQSRMVNVTAQISDSSAGVLRPGTFAEITIPVGDSRPAIVVPLTAVRPSERGFIAFVVAGDSAVERIVTLGMRTADGAVEVRTGLTPGEKLVIRGGDALRDGVAVTTGGTPAASRPAP